MQLIYPRASTPAARGSNRMTGKQCARERCFHTGGICSDAEHASGWPLCACAIASWMFCVLGLPWQGFTKARLKRKTMLKRWRVKALKRDLVFEFYASTFQRINDSASAYPTRSNPVSASDLPPQSPVFSLCKHDCHPCRSADVLAG